MQNHLEISSKTQFWTRNVRILSKSLTESLRKVYVIFQDLSRRTHKSPYGPIRAHIWAHKGPYGPIWAPTRTGIQPGLGPNPAWALICNTASARKKRDSQKNAGCPPEPHSKKVRYTVSSRSLCGHKNTKR